MGTRALFALIYDTAVSFVSDWSSHTVGDTICLRQADTSINIPSQRVEVSRAMPWCVRVYMSVCEEENMVELVEEHSTMYDGAGSRYSKKDKIGCVKTMAKNKFIYFFCTVP